jgi:hypothetical protein
MAEAADGDEHRADRELATQDVMEGRISRRYLKMTLPARGLMSYKTFARVRRAQL